MGNDEILDAFVRHQVLLLRATRTEMRRILALLTLADKDLVEKIARSLERGTLKDGSYSTARLEALLENIRDTRGVVMDELAKRTKDMVTSVALSEPAAAQAMITQSVGASIEFATVAPATLRSLVTQSVIQGAVMDDWFKRLKRADTERIQTAIRLGVSQGETIQQITKRVRASDNTGAVFQTQRDAEAIARTAVNAVSNDAREAFFDENSDIITGLRWTSTLDGRTSAICRARDGKVYPLGSKIRPPAHFNCRSVMTPIIDGAEYANKRPYVIDTRTRKQREIDFKDQAREQLGAGASAAQVNSRANYLKSEWIATHVGQVNGKTDYNSWLKRQPAAFQDEVMGPTKGALFRRGGLSQDQFVDMQTGKELTLNQLYARYPEAFQKANVAH